MEIFWSIFLEHFMKNDKSMYRTILGKKVLFYIRGKLFCLTIFLILDTEAYTLNKFIQTFQHTFLFYCVHIHKIKIDTTFDGKKTWIFVIY